jgi:Rps23 Pro-64 3,4-dihydroxylase Tpa1-like proline 4-hydroxylase
MQVTERHDQPFSYLLAEACLSPAAEQALLDWFEADAPWKLVSQDFYDQYEFSLFDTELPRAAAALVDPSHLETLRRELSDQFATTLGPQVDIVAHKLVAGQRIGIHNDHLPGGETHRLTVQLNRGLTDEDGGFMMLFNSDDAADVHRILRPVSGTALGFAISPASHHAVSRMHSGERFTLVYSFHAVERD